MRSAAVAQERMRKLVGLAVQSSDSLSSVACGPEAMITVLALAGAGALGYAIPISAAIVVLMLAVGLSYGQTVRAYPGGGGSMRALVYAASLGQPVLAVHISPNESEAARFEAYWHAWGDHLPLEVVVSPYRAIVAPLARYLEELHGQRPDVTLTVIVPELVPHPGMAASSARWYREPTAAQSSTSVADRCHYGAFPAPVANANGRGAPGEAPRPGLSR